MVDLHESKEPSEQLLVARRAVDGMSEVTILKDLAWNEILKKWVFHCRLSILSSGNLVPPKTDWFVLIDDGYPNGSISFYPALENGISFTFQHQRYNGLSINQNLWRQGNICLTLGVMALERVSYEDEPFEYHKRLKWHFDRALLWLEAAAKGELTLPGEPFELPDFPNYTKYYDLILGFSEDAFSFQTWQTLDTRIGFVEIGAITENALFVMVFKDANGKPIYSPSWGTILSSSDKAFEGIWVLLDKVPILEPWQAPNTWGELRQIFKEQDKSLDHLLKQLVRRLRDDNLHLALIGFPIPEYIGDKPYLVHWQAMVLPRLATKGMPVPNGFRSNESGYWQQDRRTVLASSNPLFWVNTENWHTDQITTRGRLAERLSKSRVLLLGVGALGSVIAESLVRTGIQYLTLMDDDVIEMGNLVRHTLTFSEINRHKAESTSSRLNSISPHARIDFRNNKFHDLDEEAQHLFSGYDLIVDCTGSDLVLQNFEKMMWSERTVFVSLSLGIAAQRLYCYVSKANLFSFSQFKKEIAPWIDRDWNDYGDQPLPREGIGCWHPVFPARFDDITLFAAAGVKYIENTLTTDIIQPNLTIFEQQFNNGIFSGISMVKDADV